MGYFCRRAERECDGCGLCQIECKPCPNCGERDFEEVYLSAVDSSWIGCDNCIESRYI